MRLHLIKSHKWNLHYKEWIYVASSQQIGLSTHITISQSWYWIWKLCLIKKIEFMFWVAYHNSMHTLSLLIYYNMITTHLCSQCGMDNYPFLHCVRDYIDFVNLGFIITNMKMFDLTIDVPITVITFFLWGFGGLGEIKIQPASHMNPFPYIAFLCTLSP